MVQLSEGERKRACSLFGGVHHIAIAHGLSVYYVLCTFKPTEIDAKGIIHFQQTRWKRMVSVHYIGYGPTIRECLFNCDGF